MQVKQFIIIGSMLLALNFPKQAQAQISQLGFEGGPGLRRLWGNTHVNANEKLAPSVNAGIRVAYRLNKVFSLQTGLNYELKGGMQSFDAVDQNGDPLGKFRSYNNFNYLTVPLSLRIHWGKQSQWYGHVGNTFGYLMRVKVVIRNPSRPMSKHDPISNVTSFNYCAFAGIGYQKDFGNRWRGSIELRKQVGFTHLIPEAIVINDGKLHTTSSYILLGWSYSLLKQ